MLILAHCINVVPKKKNAYFQTRGHITESGSYRTEASIQRKPGMGDIWVPFEALGLNAPNVGDFCFLEVAEDEPGEYSTKYRATATPELGFQIVSVSFPSSSGFEVKSASLKPVGEPRKRKSVLIRFSDGIIAGPVELKGVGTQWQIEENSMQHLQPAWIAPKEINVHHESGFGRRRESDLYFATAPLPPTTKQIDISDPIFSARRVLEYVRKSQAPNGLLSRDKIKEVATLVGQIPPESEVGPRINTIRERLNAILKVEELASPLITAALQSKTVVQQLELLKQKTISEVKAEAQVEFVQKNAELTNLAESREKLQKEIDELASEEKKMENDIAQKMTQIARARERMAEAVKAELQRIAESPETYAARLAVSQLLQVNEADLSADVRTSAMQIKGKSLSSVDAAVEHLLENLARIGCGIGASRKQIAGTVIAAAVAGLNVTFRGTMGRLLAESCLTSLYSEHQAIAIVPTGAVLEPEWANKIASVVSSSSFTGVMVEGVNRCCWETVGGWLIRESSTLPAATKSRLRVLAVAIEGPAGMELPIIHASTGPVIHTDSITWRDPHAEVEPGQLAINEKSPSGDAKINISEEWGSLLGSLPSARFLSSTNRLLVALNESLDPEQQRAIAIADCVMPFLAACRVPRDQISDLIEEVADSRAKRAAELLFPAER